MTDPGNYSVLQDDEKNIDVILITHEHSDHLHIDSLKKVLENNPQAQIITNTSVGKILDIQSTSYTVLDDTKNMKVGDVLFEAYGTTHCEIYEAFGQVENTGYFIDDRLFYPGDALYDPKRSIEILALPVAGPWINISEAIKYALMLSPTKAFPVHDGGLKHKGGSHAVPKNILPEHGIEFLIIDEGEEHIF